MSNCRCISLSAAAGTRPEGEMMRPDPRGTATEPVLADR